eukprot:symbB.v1.2.006698.t1/scaffold404.1/size210989/4
MVILDGRCLCVQSCCCLNLHVPALKKTSPSSWEKSGTMMTMISSPIGLTKNYSTRSLSSEVTRMESSRESSSSDSQHWENDFELTGWSLFRTRRFVAIPDGLLDEEANDASRKEDDTDDEAKKRKLRRAFLDEGGTCHW